MLSQSQQYIFHEDFQHFRQECFMFLYLDEDNSFHAKFEVYLIFEIQYT